MKILVIGHSNALTDAQGESEGHWPVRMRDGLRPAIEDGVELVGIRFVPYGEKAVPYALAKVQELQADYVVLSLGTYMCVVGVVSLRIRQRFGERAERVYTRLEQAISRRTERRGALAARLNRIGRRAARKLIGTATFATPEEVIACYADVIKGVAGFEHMQMVVMGEQYFSREQRRDNPRMLPTIKRVHREMKALANEHRFLWANVEAAFQATGRRDEMNYADGVHNTPAGHQAIADMLVDLIVKAEAARA